MYLAKFLSSQGLCSRRKAAILVKSGQVMVNGQVTINPAWLVTATDEVICQGQIVSRMAKQQHCYLLFNKPAKLITSLIDERGRQTVISYLASRGLVQRVLPVGRLDYLTTGLLLLSDDGDFIQQMSHPRFALAKHYQITLSRPFAKADFAQLARGVILEDGFIKPDKLAIINSQQTVISLEIHSGRNRIIRRIFAFLGYKLVALHRTQVGPYALGDLPIGAWKVIARPALAKAQDI